MRYQIQYTCYCTCYMFYLPLQGIPTKFTFKNSRFGLMAIRGKKKKIKILRNYIWKYKDCIHIIKQAARLCISASNCTSFQLSFSP